MYTIAFKCPADRLSTFIDLITGEGMQISVKADVGEKKVGSLLDNTIPTKERKRYSVHRGPVPLPKLIYDLIPETSFITVSAIESVVANQGYAKSSAGSTVSRLLQAGFVTREGQQVRRTGTPFDITKIVYTKGKE